MSTSSKRAVDTSSCPTWIYGPQVSEKNSRYGVGGKTWRVLYDSCERIGSEMYGRFNRTTISKMMLSQEDKTEELIAIAIQNLRRCKSILDVLLIHSAFINAFGISVETPITDLEKIRLSKVFKAVYEETKTLLENEANIDIFVTPAQFDTLDNNKSPRPANIVITLKSTRAVEAKYKLKNVRSQETLSFSHPIKKEAQLCLTTENTDCTKLFEKVENSLFKPVADVIACHCSFFKNKLKRTASTDVTLKNQDKLDNISRGDYTYFAKSFQHSSPSNKPPMIIKKYKDTDTTCAQKTYLSQLFEKVCIILYRPYYIKAKSAAKEDIIAAARQNLAISRYSGMIYGVGHLSVFETPIVANTQLEKSHVPVFFSMEDAGQQEKIYFDDYAGPSTQFFTDVMKELLDNDVFVPSPTFYNNQRYEINRRFDIEKLQCYNRLPTEIKTAEFKKEATEAFFLFVGNLLHFAVANNIELPFKLSRVYILKLFNLFDFAKDERTIDKRMLLISLYLLEKAPAAYTKNIIQIFEDPKYLLDPALIAIMDFDEENKNPYSENKKELINNVIDYLYDTAFNEYFYEDPKLKAFFNGMNNIQVDEETLQKMAQISFSNYTFQEKLSVVRKADIYLSGFGLNYDVIKRQLIPRITMRYDDDLYKSPLEFLNNEAKFKKEYLAPFDTEGYSPEFQNVLNSIQDTEIVRQLKKFCLFYTILLNRGQNISTEFIAQYNQKFFNIPYNIATTTNHTTMTNEDYHNEFIKLLLKAWSGTSSILNKNYVVLMYQFQNSLPKTHTCFNMIDFFRDYKTVAEMYKDLILLVTEGTNFGEALMGGRKKKK